MSTLDDMTELDAAMAAVDHALLGIEDATPSEGVGRLIRPKAHLYQETVFVDEGERFKQNFRERQMSVVALSFEYDGFVVRAGDERQRLFYSTDLGMQAFERDRTQESQARYVLESFGAIEIALLEDHGVAPDSNADYVVTLEGQVQQQCAFAAYAVPQLRSMGWDVTVAEDYPYKVLEDTTPWYAVVREEEEKADWFNLELGVEVNGHRVNLLPVLLNMIDEGGQLDFNSLQRSVPRFVEIPGAGRYLPVQPDRFNTLMRVVAELYQGQDRDGDTVSFPGVRANSLSALEDEALGSDSGAAPRFMVESAEHVQKRLRMVRSMKTMPEPAADTGLRATLRPYQLDGLRFLQRLRAHDAGGVLADDMGLGKTLQTIAHLCVEHKSGRMEQGPSLIIAPTSLVGNWHRELGKFAPHLRVCVLHGPQRAAQQPEAAGAHLVITSFPVLVRDLAFFEELEFYYVILDEAQTIKNPRSRAAQAVRALNTTHRLCLSGTPIENNLDELWAQFDFLMPGLLGDEAQFRQFFRVPIEQQQDEMRLSALRQQVGPFILRRMKDTVAKDLPKKTELVRPVELQGKQRDLYESIRVAAHEQVRSAIKKKGVGASTLTILDALMKLRQLCCDPRLVRGEAARFVRESAKYQMLFEMLEQQLGDGRRILIFSQFTSMLSLIAAGLKERDTGYVSLTGSTPDRDRQVRAFENGDVDVFLISLKAGGTGLNLVSADTVIHYDPWWNPAAQDQATDRAYRIGQTRPVFVYNLIAAGSVEERMMALQKRKRRLAENIIGSGVNRAAPSLNEAEVEHLLSPLEG